VAQASRLCGLLELIGGEEAAVRETGSPVLQVDDAPDFGFEGLANFVEQIGKGGVISSLRNGRPGEADVIKFPDVGFKGIYPRPLCHGCGDLVNLFFEKPILIAASAKNYPPGWKSSLRQVSR